MHDIRESYPGPGQASAKVRQRDPAFAPRVKRSFPLVQCRASHLMDMRETFIPPRMTSSENTPALPISTAGYL